MANQGAIGYNGSNEMANQGAIGYNGSNEMANQGAIGYNDSNIMLVHNDNPTDMSLVAMLASCSPVPCKVRSVGGGLVDSLTSCGQRLFFSPTFEASAEDRDEDDDCSQPVEKKRRLSFDQVKSLEKSFELENRLDPERKTQLAQDLKLQPRQVSVWFQNRRARWKTKKLEGDFEVLTADYNRLKGELEVMLDENKQLQIEVNSLTAKVRTSQTSHAVGDPPEEKVKSKTALTPPSEKSEKLEPAPPELNNASSENGSQSVQARIEEASFEVPNREAFSSGSASSQISNVDSRPYSGSLVVPPENIVQPQVSLEMDSNFIRLGDNLFDQMLSPASQSNPFKPEDVSNEDDASNFLLAHLEDGKVLPWWEWA